MISFFTVAAIAKLLLFHRFIIVKYAISVHVLIRQVVRESKEDILWRGRLLSSITPLDCYMITHSSESSLNLSN